MSRKFLLLFMLCCPINGFCQLWGIGDHIDDKSHSLKAMRKAVVHLEEDLVGMKYMAAYYDDYVECYYYNPDKIIFALAIIAKTEKGLAENIEMLEWLKKHHIAKVENGYTDRLYTYQFFQVVKPNDKILIHRTKPD